MTSEPMDIVEAGYDCIAVRHLAWINEVKGDPRLRFLHDLIARLPAHPKVLDLGCGAGVPSTALLAEHGDVVGVDLSSSQLDLARQNVPNARFIKAEMTAVELPPASFDGVTAFYSISHVPRARPRPKTLHHLVLSEIDVVRGEDPARHGSHPCRQSPDGPRHILMSTDSPSSAAGSGRWSKAG